MQERGINSTFKKIIYESSEMVFLADDTYPYSIFYGNESFENQIGESLEERNLVGLGLDINAYIFKEELVLSHQERDFAFHLELPQDNGSNYFLFYKGKEIRTQGLPARKEIHHFFKSQLDLIALGQHDYLTYVNAAVTPILGYEPAEILNSGLCLFLHPEDVEAITAIWKRRGGDEQMDFFAARIKGKDGGYRYLECSVQFTEEHFYLIARDKTDQQKLALQETIQHNLLQKYHGGEESMLWSWSQGNRSLEWGVGETNMPQSTSQALEHKIALQLSKLDSQETHWALEVQLEETYWKLAAEKYETTWLGIVSEQTNQKQLENSNDLIHQLFQNTPEAIMVTQVDGSVFLCNEECKKLLGLDSSNDFAHLDELSDLFIDGTQWNEWLEQARHDENTKRFPVSLSRRDETKLELELSFKLMAAPYQEYILISFQNVVEKISLEKSLAESSDFLMNLTEQVPGGLYQLVLDESGTMSFSFLSKGIASVLGLSEEEVENFSDISLAIARVHPLDLPQVIMSSVASAKKQEPWQCQFRVKSDLDPSGYTWILGAARPQSMENGDMVWYGYLTDISQQKEFESKLDVARKTAEKASQIKSDFLSMISHELRTPLNAISGSVYAMLQDDPSENQKSTLGTINFAVENLIIMINDLLDFQKIEAGKLSIENAPFQLKDLVEQVMKGLTFHAKDSKNDLNLHLDGDLNLMVKGDKTRLSQILNNLITNALKFTQEGNVDVSLKLLRNSGTQAKVYFEVKDNGIGIAAENQEKIFNDFDQVQPSFSTKYGGTGLGLAITRRLLQLMGGTIGLDSQLGKGSTFYFELPFEVVNTPIANGAQPDRSRRDFSNLHFLMAEDNDVNALVLGKIIKRWGFTYDRVEDGAEAVEACKSKCYDCILMDIQMPVMDGFEATVAIKEMINTPVIALTAAAKLEIMEKIEECGFDGFVAKPIDASELLKKIQDVILEVDHSS